MHNKDQEPSLDMSQDGFSFESARWGGAVGPSSGRTQQNRDEKQR
jgi:hypothetical protein